MKRFEGDFEVNASPQEVMDYCSDLQNIFPALPGLVEIKEATAGAGIVLIDAGVSFIKGRFTVRIEQSKRNTDYLKFRGHGDGIGNAVDFESTVRVDGSSGGSKSASVRRNRLDSRAACAPPPRAADAWCTVTEPSYPVRPSASNTGTRSMPPLSQIGI